MSDQDLDEIYVIDPDAPRRGPIPVPTESKPEMVDHPDHYTRGPKVTCPECEHVWTLECIEVIRHIRDGRLFTAMKYLWRVSFGGKWDDHEDIEKSHWYGNDYLEHPIGIGGQ